MAAPIPPKPAPTMTASKSSEVMLQTVPQVPAIIVIDSVLEGARPGRIQGGDAGHGPIALLPRFRGRVEHIELNGVVGDRLGRVGGQLRFTLVLVILDRGRAGEVAVGHLQHGENLAGMWLV